MIRAYMLLFLTVCLAFLVGDDVQAVTVMSNTEILRQTEPITAYTLLAVQRLSICRRP